MIRRGPTLSNYYLDIEGMAREMMNRADARYLLNIDFEEYLDYLVSELQREPLHWQEEEISIQHYSVKETLQGRRPFTTDRHRIRIRIPHLPHGDRQNYLRFLPSKMTASGEPDWKLYEDGILVLEVEAKDAQVTSAIEAARFWLDGRNHDIEEGNSKLRDRIRPVLEAKRKQVQAQLGEVEATLQRLNLPLYRDPNAKAKPIEIKARPLRTAIEKPKERPRQAELTLDSDDVRGLVDFIEDYARGFEVSAKTYAKMDEEELRDLLVTMMNANYPGSATAERFNKLGKTDITLRVNAGHILVCECKFWSGSKAYCAALEQLFGYLTWRQNYGVLINFCKAKDMSKAVAGVKTAMNEHATFTQNSLNESGDTRFSTRHEHPQDPAKAVEIHHLFIDLSV